VAAILGFLAGNAASPLSALKYTTFGVAGLVAVGCVLPWWGRRPRETQAIPVALGMGMGAWIAFPDSVGLLWARVLSSAIVLGATLSVFYLPWRRIAVWWQALPPIIGLVGVLIIQLFAASYFAFFPVTLLVVTFLALYYRPLYLRITLGIVVALTLVWVSVQGRSFSDLVIGALTISVLAIVSLRVSGTVMVASRALKTLERQAVELRHRAAQLEVARAQAEASSRAKSDHLSRMSHELRTPMSAILGFADLLSMGQPRQDQTDNIAAIQTAGEHLARLIDDVLEVARLEAGKAELVLEPVLVGEAITGAQRLLRLSEEAQGITVAIVGDHGHTYVRADAQRLRQVLLNLLSNAVKYNRPDGKVTMRTTAHVGRVTIEVADTGIGIAPSLQARLFQPFDRLGAERSTIEGTGLGLALSKAWVEAMGGTIAVSSEVGGVTTFSVELTRAEAFSAGRRRGEPDGQGARRRGAGRTVVYVEDNLDNVELVRTVLSQERPLVQLTAYERGLDALASMKSASPDLILLDLHLGDIKGDEVLMRIREQPRLADIPVVILSADATVGQRERLLLLGACEYVTKPFKVKELLKLVDEKLSAAAQAPAHKAVPGVAVREGGARP
jgi:signal transduction histidine kinase/ActR/RegA family two-component response regulator